jgi:hypothetical protein
VTQGGTVLVADGEGTETALASRVFPRQGGSLGPAHKDKEGMSKPNTDSVVGSRGANNGGCLSQREMGAARGLAWTRSAP